MPQRHYRLGKRFNRYAVALKVLTAALFFCFYFIYLYVFTIDPRLLFLIFLIACTACIWAEGRGADKLRQGIYYTVEADRLVYHQLKRELAFKWSDFTAVYRDEFSLRDLCHTRFRLGEKVLKLNSYLDDPCGLAWDIICHIEPYVKVSEEIRKEAAALSGVRL